MSDIIELQHKLQEARNEIPQSKARIRTAAATIDHHRDASELLELGVSPGEVSVLLGMPLSEVARIEEYDQKRRKFLTTGNLDLPGQITGVSIFQR